MANHAISTSNVHPFPAVAPGFKLAPTRIGRDGRFQIVYIECPEFCVIDHVDNWQYDLEDVSHYGPMSDVIVPTMTGDFARIELFTRVATDPTATEPSLRAAHVLVGDGDKDDARLTPDMADDVADKLISFAADIRHAARTARLHNQTTAGDSDPDMDEALRRVRGGAA